MASASSELGLRQLADGFDWASLPSGSTVVDVGGARGHVSAYLANEFKHLSFVVQDLPAVIDGTDGDTSYQIPEEVADRVKLMSHDFFNEQPVKGAAVYIVRYILHNWSDTYAAKILRRLVDVMEPGARIVVSDHILPEPGELPLLRERYIRPLRG